MAIIAKIRRVSRLAPSASRLAISSARRVIRSHTHDQGSRCPWPQGGSGVGGDVKGDLGTRGPGSLSHRRRIGGLAGPTDIPQHGIGNGVGSGTSPLGRWGGLGPWGQGLTRGLFLRQPFKVRD